MANVILNPSIIAKAAVRILDNELVMANRVYRGYEDEFAKRINGYEVGDTITIRKPNQFRVRTVITADSPVQDVTEGKLTMQINQVRGVDFSFTSQQLTLNIGELADRVIKPAMVQLANAIDTTLMGEFFRKTTGLDSLIPVLMCRYRASPPLRVGQSVSTRWRVLRMTARPCSRLS